MPDPQITTYIAKQKSPQKEICQVLRKIIQKTFPGIEEAMKWGVPAFADGQYYFVALKDHVNLGFSIKGLTAAQKSLFQGSGKTVRVLEIKTLPDIDEKKIVKLLKLVKKH